MDDSFMVGRAAKSRGWRDAVQMEKGSTFIHKQPDRAGLKLAGSRVSQKLKCARRSFIRLLSARRGPQPSTLVVKVLIQSAKLLASVFVCPF